jgi:MFS family permease
MAAALAFVGELVPMYVASAMMLIGAAAGMKLLKEPERHHAQQARGNLRPTDPHLRPFMLMWFAFFLTFSAVQITTAFYIQDRLGVTDHAGVVRIASFCLMSMALVITLVQALVLQMFRVRPVILLRLCGPAFMLALATMALADSTSVLILGFAFLGLSFACATPGINGGASMAVEPGQQGAAAGYLAAANTVGAILGPLTGTTIYRIAPTAVMVSGIGLFALMSLYALTIRIPARRSGN